MNLKLHNYTAIISWWQIERQLYYQNEFDYGT